MHLHGNMFKSLIFEYDSRGGLQEQKGLIKLNQKRLNENTNRIATEFEPIFVNNF